MPSTSGTSTHHLTHHPLTSHLQAPSNNNIYLAIPPPPPQASNPQSSQANQNINVITTPIVVDFSNMTVNCINQSADKK